MEYTTSKNIETVNHNKRTLPVKHAIIINTSKRHRLEFEAPKMDFEAQLPIIDLKKAQNKSYRMEIASQLVKTLETVGFLLIDNVPGVDHESLLKNARQFFSLSSAEKQMVAKNKWNIRNRNKYRGYFPVQPGEISYKEGFEMGLEDCTFNDPDIHPMFMEPNLWPTFNEGFEEFRKDMEQYYQAMINAGTEILRLLALGSGLDEHWFESMFLPDTLSTLRLLHYPKRPNNPPNIAVDGDTVICCKEHSDSGFVTLLSTFHYQGLQIRTENNEWMDVAPRPNSLVMNIGDILSKLSNGRFRSTKHRVVDTVQDRFSVPFFFEPKYSAKIGRELPFEESVSKMWTQKRSSLHMPEIGTETKYGPWLIGKMQTFAEFRDILTSYPVTSVGV